MSEQETRPDLRGQSTEISNRIAALHREHYGRGASRVRTMIHQDVVMTRLEDCFTTAERMMAAEGAFAQVRETRTMSQDFVPATGGRSGEERALAQGSDRALRRPR